MIPRNRFAFWLVFMLPLAVTLLAGCAESTQQEKQAIAEVTAPFAASAITLNLTAEPQLNLWNEMSNSCTVLVIQAANNPALDKILDDPMQLKSLFNGAGTADEILQVDRYTVMPGQKIRYISIAPRKPEISQSWQDIFRSPARNTWRILPFPL